MINFNNKTFIKTCRKCDPDKVEIMGQAPAYFSNIQFINSTFSQFVSFNHPFHGKDVIYDRDGSLFGKISRSGKGFITPYFKHLENGSCEVVEDVSVCSDKCFVC